VPGSVHAPSLLRFFFPSDFDDLRPISKNSTRPHGGNVFLVRINKQEASHATHPLATLDLAIADVAAAEALVLTRAKGFKEARDAKLEVLLADLGRVSGTARLVAQSAGDRARYDWQYSRDETTWTNAPATMQCKTDISGLLPGLVYFFRVRPTTVAGMRDWSQVVSLLVA
jgi:hypothetical protein